jgi:sugar lactone lactonase YvrE
VDWDIEQVTDPITEHGEGPCWSPSWGGLRWVDMTAGDVLHLTEDGGVERTHVDSVAAVVRPRADGGAIVGVERGVALFDESWNEERRVEIWSDPGIRMNEGGCAPDGSFYCGSMAYDKTVGAASLYRVSPDLAVTTELEDVTISNGIDWSPDWSRAYYNDTQTGSIAVFDWDPDRGLHHRRTFVTIRDDGRPDGLTVDSRGGVWCAVISHGQVHHFSPEGRLVDVIDLPVKRVTACTFGDDDLGTLYVTSTPEGLEPGEDPLAGALFRVRVGVTGQPVRAFAG